MPELSQNVFDDASSLATCLKLLEFVLILPTGTLAAAAPIFLAAVRARIPELHYEFKDPGEQ